MTRTPARAAGRRAARSVRLAAAASLGVAVLAPAPCAQTVQEAFADNPIPDLFAGLMNLTLSEEISGASFRIDNGNANSEDTRFSTFKLPWSEEYDLGTGTGRLHLEAAGGLMLADDSLRFDTPSGVATVDEDWTALGAQVGVGWTQPLGRGWAVRPGAALALSCATTRATTPPGARSSRP